VVVETADGDVRRRLTCRAAADGCAPVRRVVELTELVDLTRSDVLAGAAT
jgi:hypothetical protein